MLIRILSLFLLTYQVSGYKVCRTRDYTAVLGSSDLTITEIVASVTPFADFLVIGGTATFNGRRRVLQAQRSDNELLEFDINEYADDDEEQTQDSHSTRRRLSITAGSAFGFIYTVNLISCEVGVFTGFAELSGGIKAVYTDFDPSYTFVGYDSNDQEYIIRQNDGVSSTISLTNTDTVLTSGLGWHNQILVVAGAAQLKLFELEQAKTLQLSFNSDISIVHQITSDSQILATLNRSLNDQNLIGIFQATCSYDEITEALSTDYTLNEIDHGFTTSFVARLDVQDDMKYMCSHQVAGAGSVFFDLLAPAWLTSYEEQTWAQCIAVDASTMQYLMLTTSNKYQVIWIDFDTGQYTKTDAISAIPGVSAFDSSLTGLKADFNSGFATVYGLSNTIASTSIGYNVGFVMHLGNDLNYRKNNFFESEALETNSYTDLGVVMNPNVIDVPDEVELNPDASTQVETTDLATILDWEKSWTYQMNECQPQTFVNETYQAYQDISIALFEDFLGDSNQNMPPFFFDPDEVFDASYINDNSIRSSCFPAYQNTYSMVPTDEYNKEMLNYDSSRLIWQWNPMTTVTNGLVNIDVTEFAASGEIFHNLQASYNLTVSYLTVQMFGSSTSRTFELNSKKLGLKPGDTKVFWECYSDYCPDFFNVNSQNLTISVDGTKTSSRQASGIYVLSIRSEDVVQKLFILESFMIIIRYTSTGLARTIRISQPWDRWVAGGHSPYNVGRQPERSKSRRSHLELEEVRDYIFDSREVDEIEEILTWTDEQLEEAYAESLERYNADYIEYHTAISMTNQGLITVNFFPDIMIPSYILRSEQQYIDSSHTRDETEAPDDSQDDSEQRRRLNEKRLFRFLQEEDEESWEDDEYEESWEDDDSFGFEDDYFDSNTFDSEDFAESLGLGGDWESGDAFGDGDYANGDEDFGDFEDYEEGSYEEEDGYEEGYYEEEGSYEEGSYQEEGSYEEGSYEEEDGNGEGYYDEEGSYEEGSYEEGFYEEGSHDDYGDYNQSGNNIEVQDLDLGCRMLSVRKRKKKGKQKRKQQKQTARNLEATDAGLMNPCEIYIDDDDYFTEDEDIVCNFNEVLNVEENTCDELQIYFGYFEDLYSMRIESSEENDDGNVDEIAYTFELVSISRSQVQFQFNFDDPYAISITDKLILELDFNTFDDKGTYETNTVPMRKQITEIKELTTMAQATAGCATTAIVGAAIVQVVMNGALAQIWGMINGLQLAMHLPTLNLSFPEVAFTVVEKLLGVFTFDIPTVEYKSLPDGLQPHSDKSILTDVKDDSADQLKINLNTLTYGSAYLTDTLGSFYILFLAIMICLILILLQKPFEFLTPIRKTRVWLKKNLLWNFILRMFLESAIVNTYCFMLTLLYGDWIQFGGIINMSSAWILASISFLLPFFILTFYFFNYDRMNSDDEEVAEEFDEKWGAPMEGLNKDNKWSLAYPVMFLTRRICFVLIVLWLFNFVILQLALHIIMTIISYAYLAHFKPFEDRIVQKLEVFNEVMFLIMINVLFCFTDIIRNNEDKEILGYAFIFLLTINIVAHLFFLVKATIEDMKRGYREKSYRLASRNVRTHSTFLNSNKTWRCCYVTFWCKCLNKRQACVKFDLFWLWLGYRGKYTASETTIRKEDDFDNVELISIKNREEVKSNIQDYNSKDEETNIMESQIKLMERIGKQLRQQAKIPLPIKQQLALNEVTRPATQQIDSTARRQKSNFELELDPFAFVTSQYRSDPEIDGTKTKVKQKTKVFTIAQTLKLKELNSLKSQLSKIENMKSPTKPVEEVDLTDGNQEEKQLQKTLSMFNIGV